MAIAIVGFLAAGVGFALWTEYNLLLKETDSLDNPTAWLTVNNSREKALYIINKGEGNVVSYQITVSGNQTVLSLLEKLAKRENFKIDSKIYKGLGVLVTAIDGVRNGENNKYWQYWLNGELPMISVDEKEVKGGDRVEWKFATDIF